jgi:hypothetical protein
MAKSGINHLRLERRHPRLKTPPDFSARNKWIWRTSGNLAEGDYAASLQIVQHAHNRCLTHRGAYSAPKAINAAAGYERDGKKVREAMTIESAGGNCFHDKAAFKLTLRFIAPMFDTAGVQLVGGFSPNDDRVAECESAPRTAEGALAYARRFKSACSP